MADHFSGDCGPDNPFVERWPLSKTRGQTLPAQVVCVAEARGEFGVARWRWEDSGLTRFTYHYGKSAAEFWENCYNLTRRNGSTWVFAWRAYETFTNLHIWEEIDSGRLRYDDPAAERAHYLDHKSGTPRRGLIVVNDPPTILILKARDTTGTVRIVDLANYTFPGWSPEVGLEERLNMMHDWLCEWRGILIRHSLGSWKNTLASQAYTAFRQPQHWHQFILHRQPEVLRLERDAYYGGRCECFRLGQVKGPIHHLDGIAHYAAAAAVDKIPMALVDYSESLSPGRLTELQTEFAVIADVTLRTNVNAYPLRVKGDTVWPVGEFRTALAGPELWHAIVSGHVQRVHRAACYQRGPSLASWAQLAQQLRNEIAEGAIEHCQGAVKGLIVSLFGKLGQKRQLWVDVPDQVNDQRWECWYQIDPDTDRTTQYRAIAGYVQKQVQSGEHNESIPYLAAWITSAARAQLWRWMMMAGFEHVIYVDTDTLMLEQGGFDNLHAQGQTDQRLVGKLKIEGVYKSVELRGIKHHVCDGVLTCAGLPRGVRLGPDWSGSWTEQEKLCGALARKLPPTSRLVTIKKRWSKLYRHGRVDPQGNVWPYVAKAGGDPLLDVPF